MTEKVKLTQAQAEAIERRRKIGDKQFNRFVLYHITNGWSETSNEQLNKLSVSDIAKAWYIGYEVEPSYSEGEWVIYWDGEKYHITKVIDVQGFNNRIQFDSISDWKSLKDVSRHATESEIAQEKERRFWNKHGRGVWEIREDDILEYLGDLYIIDCFDSEEVYLKNSIDRKTNYAEPFGFVKKHFKVVCLSENRLDISHE